MKYKEISNAELIVRLENACFTLAKDFNNEVVGNEFAALEWELCRRLGCSTDEVQVIAEDIRGA